MLNVCDNYSGPFRLIKFITQLRLDISGETTAIFAYHPPFTMQHPLVQRSGIRGWPYASLVTMPPPVRS